MLDCEGLVVEGLERRLLRNILDKMDIVGEVVKAMEVGGVGDPLVALRRALEDGGSEGLRRLDLVQILEAKLQEHDKAAGKSEGTANNKFAGSFEAMFGSLEEFQGGVEGLIGPPDPNVLEAMKREVRRPPVAALLSCLFSCFCAFRLQRFLPFVSATRHGPSLFVLRRSRRLCVSDLSLHARSTAPPQIPTIPTRQATTKKSRRRRSESGTWSHRRIRVFGTKSTKMRAGGQAHQPS